MARPEKVAEVELLTEKMQKSEGLILADFSGLTVLEVNELRRKCREQGVEVFELQAVSLAAPPVIADLSAGDDQVGGVLATVDGDNRAAQLGPGIGGQNRCGRGRPAVFGQGINHLRHRPGQHGCIELLTDDTGGIR